VDIIEEVASHYGFDNIPTKTSPVVDQLQMTNHKVDFQDMLRGTLAGRGFREIVSLNLVLPATAELFLPEKSKLVELLNPISPELSVFRPDLILSLLAAVSYNRNRQISNLRLFEIGHVAWYQDGEKGISEKKQIAGLYEGKLQEQTWYAKPRVFDFFDIKGAVTALLQKAGIHGYQLGKSTGSIWDSQSASISANGQIIGTFGKLREDICSHFKLREGDIFAFSFDFDEIYDNRADLKKYDPVPRFPSVPFDLALMVDAAVPVGDLEAEIVKSAGPHLSSVTLFDFYIGDQVGAGKKSVAFSLTFSSKERTLSEEEVKQAITKTLSQLSHKFGAELRPAQRG
jgi:phenylalanyl-tRNA synthetase beta chain